MYSVELVWNREFHFVPYGGQFQTLGQAVGYAKALLDMGDGACVKKSRVLNDLGEVVWVNGQSFKVKGDSDG